MKLLYFGDLHSRPTKPENRLDDFQNTVELKTREIIQIAKTNKVAAFMQPGDFWESPNPSLDFTTKILKRWFDVDFSSILQTALAQGNLERKLYELVELLASGKISAEDLVKNLLKITAKTSIGPLPEDKLTSLIPMIGVAGNHELHGNNIRSLPKTMIGFMEQLGLVKFATKKTPFFLETEDGLKIAITGSHYHLDIDTPEHLDDYVVEEKLGDVHIHIVHGMLSDKSMGIIRHTLIDQIKHTKADLTIAGHNHIGFPLTEVDGKYFVNPGGVVRQTNDLKEIARKPKVLLVDITKKSGLKLKEIYLQSAEDGELVLDRKKIEAKRERNEKVEEYKKAIRDADLNKKADITEIVSEIAQNQNLPTDIRDAIIDAISDKIQKMDGASEEFQSEAFISKIILENFMSHEHTELETSSGFNMLVGESRQGKSAVLRALDWIYECKPMGKRLIRHGKEFAKATIFLSNGYIISRYIEAKKSGKNGYFITEPNSADAEFFNTKALPDVQKILGFSLFKIDKDLQLNLNFLKQGASWFLISDMYTAPTKAKIIGSIYGTQYADAVIRELEVDEDRIKKKTDDALADIGKTEKQISEYDYLPDVENIINETEWLIGHIEELQERKVKIEAALAKRESLVLAINECVSDIASFSQLAEAKALYSQVQGHIQLRNQIEKEVTKREEFAGYVKNSSCVADRLKDVDQWRQICDNLKRLAEKRASIDAALTSREALVANISAEQQAITETEQVEAARKILANIVGLIKNRDALSQKLERSEKLAEELTELKKFVKGCDKIIYITSQAEQASQVLADIKSLVEKRRQMASILDAKDGLGQNIQAAVAQVKKHTEDLNRNVDVYKQALERAERCPICLNPIDNATIMRIVGEYKVVE